MAELDRETIALLLSILEAPRPVLAGAVLEDVHAQPGAALRRANLIVPDGYEPVATATDDHADVPVSVFPSEDGDGFGYFSPTEGWVKVDESRLVRYRADMDAIMAALLPEGGSPGRTPVALVDGCLWDAGDLRVGRRTNRASIWFARRVHDPVVWTAIRKVAGRRPTSQTRLIVTSTPPDRHPSHGLTRHLLVWVEDARSSLGLQLDCRILAGLLDGTRPSAADGPVQLIGGGKVVRLYGREFKFPKAVRAREILRLLHDRLLDGERWVPCDEIIEQLDLPAGARIRDYFKQKGVWNQLLTQRGGMCGFCLDDD